MPLHRAYFPTQAEAREKAAKAVDALNAKWLARAQAAGAQVATTAPVVDVVIEGVTLLPDPTRPDTSEVLTRITAPDGRSDVIVATMPTSQADSLLSLASGTVDIFTNKQAKIQVKGRVAASVQIYTTGATALNATHIIEDRNTGKKYQCVATSPAGAGAFTVPVTEVSTADLGDVSHGTALEFLNPPKEVNPIARVNSISSYALSGSNELFDSRGRRYVITGVINVAASSGLAGDSTGEGLILRDATDGLDYVTSLEVGETLTFVPQAPGVALLATVVEKGELAIPKGSILKSADGLRRYETTADALASDVCYARPTIKARATGSGHNLVLNEFLAFEPAIAGVSSVQVKATTAAATYPEKASSQIVGAPLEWTYSVQLARDGRWMADVYTLPFGS